MKREKRPRNPENSELWEQGRGARRSGYGLVEKISRALEKKNCLSLMRLPFGGLEGGEKKKKPPEERKETSQLSEKRTAANVRRHFTLRSLAKERKESRRFDAPKGKETGLRGGLLHCSKRERNPYSLPSKVFGGGGGVGFGGVGWGGSPTLLERKGGNVSFDEIFL